jgi:hypothetical protein
VDKTKMIAALAGTEMTTRELVEDQTVPDIMKAMLNKHNRCEADYDKIYREFLGGDVYDICYRLWKFCRDEFNYVIEKAKKQYVSSPIAMLTNGDVDCKNYALFCAGVLDAIKRNEGMDIVFVYRFANYDFLDSLLHPQDAGHVFVVVNPNTDDIWVDPVLPRFNDHLFYWRKIDKRVRSKSRVGMVGRMPAAVGSSAESDLLNAIYEYTEGLAQAMQVTQQTNTLNSISSAVLKGITASVPGLSQALSLLNAGYAVVSDTFGVGSLAARLVNDLVSNPLTAPIKIIEDIFNGRTYNTDQYWAAQYYQYYVLGKSNVTGINQIADSDVMPALKWFIDRLGVFISGRQHIIGLTKSPSEYMKYHAVNAFTTTDVNRVNAAYNVASKYFDFNGAPGSWANTEGVYDQTLVNIANASGESVEQAAAAANYSGVYSSTATGGAATVTNGSSFLQKYGWWAAAALLIAAGLQSSKS